MFSGFGKSEERVIRYRAMGPEADSAGEVGIRLRLLCSRPTDPTETTICPFFGRPGSSLAMVFAGGLDGRLGKRIGLWGREVGLVM